MELDLGPEIAQFRAGAAGLGGPGPALAGSARADSARAGSALADSAGTFRASGPWSEAAARQLLAAAGVPVVPGELARRGHEGRCLDPAVVPGGQPRPGAVRPGR